MRMLIVQGYSNPEARNRIVVCSGGKDPLPVTNNLNWNGRFPRNDIISLLDINRKYNLAESTAQDLTFEEIMKLAGGMETMRHLKMGYGSSAGLPQLRSAVADITGLNPNQVVTTQGTALGLFLLAMELCRPGDEAGIVT